MQSVDFNKLALGRPEENEIISNNKQVAKKAKAGGVESFATPQTTATSTASSSVTPLTTNPNENVNSKGTSKGTSTYNYTPQYISGLTGKNETEQKILDSYTKAYNYGEDIKAEMSKLGKTGTITSFGAAAEMQAAEENAIVQQNYADSLNVGVDYNSTAQVQTREQTNSAYQKNLNEAVSAVGNNAVSIAKGNLSVQKAQVSMTLDSALIIQDNRHFEEEMNIKYQELQLAKDQFEEDKRQFEESMDMEQEQLDQAKEQFDEEMEFLYHELEVLYS